MTPEKLLIVVSHPIQYFAPLYREIVKNPRIQLTVLFYGAEQQENYFDLGFQRNIQWDVDLLDGYHGMFLPKKFWSSLGKLWQVIKENDHILVSSFIPFYNLFAVLMARRLHKKILYRCESHLLDPKNHLLKWLKRLVLTRLFKLIDCGLYIGAQNQSYLRYYGLQQLVFSPYAVDNDYFMRQTPNQSLREKWAIKANDKVILFVGKLIRKKQPDLLLRAFAEVQKYLSCHLVFVGTGPLQKQLETSCQTQKITNVHFAGFINQSQIAHVYHSANILVLPSAYQETWGLVVNEAMACGVPAVVSTRVGCANDLVLPGQTGAIFEWDSQKDLVRAILSLLEPPNDALAKQSCLQHIRGYSLPAASVGITKACITSL